MSQKIRFTCLKVSPVLVFLLFFQVTKAQYNFGELDARFQQYNHELGKNAVLVIYKDGKIIHTKDQEDFKANTQAPVTDCTKWLTAAVVMTFVDEGKISLDDKVSKYLPIFATYSKGYITLRQCLAHMTGIEGSKIGIIKSNHYNSLEEEVNSFASKHEIQTNAGTEFRYTDIGASIAGRIVEIVGKKSFEQLAQQRLLKPLGMRNTTFQLDFDKPANPSLGALSTATDYVNFLGMLLNKGMFKGKRVLSEKAVAEMEQAQIPATVKKVMDKDAAGPTYALGAWVLEQTDDGKTTALAGPGMPGSWPIIDLCRGYAAVIFTKDQSSSQKKEIFIDIKKAIDAAIPCSN